MCIWKKMTAVEKMRKVWNFYRSIDPKMEEFLFSRWLKHPFFEEKGISIRSRVNLPMIFNRDTPPRREIRSFFERYSIDSVRHAGKWPKNESLLFSLSLFYTQSTHSALLSSNSTDPFNRFVRENHESESVPSLPPKEISRKRRISPWNDAR